MLVEGQFREAFAVVTITTIRFLLGGILALPLKNTPLFQTLPQALPPMSSIYERFQVPTAINAAGTLTRLGGSLMDPEVTLAMSEAARAFVPMDQLHAAASERIAA